MRFCQFGAGRIGGIHARNIQAHPDCELVYIVDIISEAAISLADQLGATATSVDIALNDPGIDAVAIVSSTDTHADLIEASARAGKAIFCEKPIDLSINRVVECLAVVEDCNVPLFIGFNRRFDPSTATLKKRLDDGEIGDIEQLFITNRDPGLPPIAFLKSSGGMFRDMMIHDFDMTRWLLGEEPTEVYAAASVLVDPALSAIGDIDSAVVILKTASGKLVQINNTRRAVYGYDQRIEVLGSKGMIRMNNLSVDSIEVSNAGGTTRGNPLPFFLERYDLAYRHEMASFIETVKSDLTPNPGGKDGLEALRIADAAVRSFETGLPVELQS